MSQSSDYILTAEGRLKSLDFFRGFTMFLLIIAKPFTMGLFSWTGELGAKIITSLAVLGLLWLICYWLYKRRIFIKI
jgi:predicted acyltransferase